MSRFYLRKALLTVGSKQFSTRIAFDIKKDDESDPNKAKIQLYNLSLDSRSYLEKTNEIIRLEAGYEDEIGIIFMGDILKNGVRHERNGGDIITTVMCGDGQKSIVDAYVDISMGKGTTCQQIVTAAVNKLKEYGLSVRIISGDLSKQFLQGKTYSGSVRQLLDEVTAFCGLKWSCQNNSIQIYPKEGTPASSVFLISSESGLIGLPSKGENGIIFRCLLNAQLIPQNFIQLQTKQTTGTGTYKIISVHHVGDSREGDWYTEIEGEAQGAN